MTSWADQNDLLRFGKKILDTTGTPTPTEKSLISSLASATGVGYNVARDAYVKSVLDPLLQDKVHKSMKWIINSNFVPEFVDPKENGIGLDDDCFGEETIDPAILNADGVPRPKRMFNIDTGYMEDWPNGQYIILSHSWKGQEITFPFLQRIKDNARKKEIYEMIRDSHDEDEDAKRFASFQVKKFGHLEAGKSDVELLAAQCKKDVDEQIKNIDIILSRSGRKSDYSNTGTFLADFTEFKEATFETTSLRKELVAKRKNVEVKKMADKNLEKDKQDMGVDDLQTPIENEASEVSSLNHNNNSLKVDSILLELEDKMRLAEMRLENATEKYTNLNQIPGLRSAIEEFLPVLERRKSMYKIESSIREAKRILSTGLFPSNGRKQYLWNDTICINKGDANEQNESLAMMGQWYNNADFCLVHLDTSSSTEWVSTWHSINMDSPGTWACDANFSKFEDVNTPKWSTRGWTLQELVLSKMAFYVNNLWEPLPRVVEGLGPYYYHCYYLQQHIREQDTTNASKEAKSFFSNLENLKSLMDTGEKIPYFDLTEGLEKSRRIIGILGYLRVQFPGEMNDDNSGAYIRDTISRAGYDIESRINMETPTAENLRKLFTTLGFDLNPNSIRAQIRTLIKLLIRNLVDDCSPAIEADRIKVSEFTKVPPPECCRGLSRPTLPAHDTLSLASYRECTVPIDRVYSLMGVLGVKFSAFHAEGPTKALCRLLDEVVITTNDVSIFNWAGKDLGSPVRGRSLYPSSLTAFSPEKTENYFTSRNGELAAASKEKRYRLQDTASKITLLLRQTIDFIKKTAHQDIPTVLLQTILKFIEDISLKELRPQLHHLGKLVVYLENTPTFEKYKPKVGYRTEEEKAQKSLIHEEEKPATQSNGNIASRFGFKTPQRPQMPQIPQMPQMPHISAPKLSMGLGGFGRKAKEPLTPMKESVDAPLVLHVEPELSAVESSMEEEPKSLIDEVNHWLSQDQDINSIPKEFQPLFDEIEAPKLNGPPMGKRQKPQRTRELLGSSMICPNPIMLTTSGIEGVFDIQRVIIEMQNPEHLRYQVQNAVNDSQKISGHCTISTALSMIKVNFTCEAGALKKQLDVCDVIQRALSDQEDKRTNGLKNPRPALTTGQESDNYYKKLTSLSSGFMGKVPESVDPTKQNQTAPTPDSAAQVQAPGENSEQLRVVRMLDFVQENDINLIVGEWVLARFTGVEGAKWFLCQLELGSTHSYYGRRIATDKIDFENVVPEPGLVDHWESYMRNKKNELCRIVNVLIQGRVARQYADSVTSSEIKPEIDDDSDHEGSDNKGKLKDFLFRRGTLIGAELVQTLTDIWGERLDAMLNDTILQQVPKGLRAAIMNLNENEDLLPAMFLSGVQVHMF
ncbi:hypothetical protein BHYA_0129g00020 [Botrytis hyacinthi]|uniref:Heterokaryon incompatibility domain-containing protein n=1 Tax=Botrytis hyacinthi TaxID=278943 RepID=A0A4Z1GNZ8_9HELO|nr:hypothetical protein BHYA_0129g00020 [Botrytis hyacinthi]